MGTQHADSRPVRVRFAPSPTGTLHVGSARTALYNYLFARHNGGSFVLRSEDTDTTRSRRRYEESVLADLAWLGLEWDEGPDVGGDYGPYRQSERSQIYAQAAQQLLDQGKAYRCFCSPERLEELKERCRAEGETPSYDRRCLRLTPEEVESRLAAGERATIRFRVPEAGVAFRDIIHGATSFSSGVISDFIIIRSDGGVSYNFAVVVDDAAMEITHVIRGEDHLTNTARQIMVFRALDREPPHYAHHSLILGADGGKLSKRHGATSVGDFREMGYLAPAIINYLALLSWSPGGEEEKLSLEEMVEQFDLASVARSPAIFDIQKLNWLNGLYIRDQDGGELARVLAPFLEDAGPAVSDGQLEVAETAVQTSLVTLAEAPEQIRDFFTAAAPEGPAAAELEDRQAQAVLEKALAGIDELPPATEMGRGSAPAAIEAARDLLKRLKKECKGEGIPPRVLYRTLRISLTGRTSGPEVPLLLAGLGRDEARRRLEAARS